MITIHFKEVSQGDSIILEWLDNGHKRVGIVDCNIVNGNNPTLDFLTTNSISEIEFIVLSHFHQDHFSGMADIFDYCAKNKIQIKCFYSSLSPLVSDILDKIFTSQKLQKGVERFVRSHDLADPLITDSVQEVSSKTAPIHFNGVILTFLAPQGKVYSKMATQLARKRNKISPSHSDINKLATIISISKEEQHVLLTSDAVKKNFKLLRTKAFPEMVLCQVPHHGSWLNVDQPFWAKINKIKNCPAVFSVGDEPKDKLPNDATVDFFDKNGFDVHSTNDVYGISAYFGKPKKTGSNKSLLLNSFSTSRKSLVPTTSTKYSGDKKFNVL